MSTNKRFYLSNASYLLSYKPILLDRDNPDCVIADSPHYLHELCDLLNKGHEATEAYPVDVAELRDQQRAYGFRLISLLTKQADKKSDPVERTHYVRAVNDLFEAVSSGKRLTRSSPEATTCCCGFCVRESQEKEEGKN